MSDFGSDQIFSPEGLLLKISSAEQKKAWSQVQNQSHTLSRYNSYVNHLCLYAFLSWLTTPVGKDSSPEPTIFPNENSLPWIWEVLNGTVIQVGQRRIVLIPTEAIDLEELCVPQEWVDIPEFAGDYYLAVLVNLEADEDDCWCYVCGFTTHRQLKQQGEYNPSDRTYRLRAENLIASLTVMSLTMDLHLMDDIAPLPALSRADASKLLEILGDRSIYSPRLRVDIPFERWGALLANPEWLQKLYDRRTGREIVQESKTSINNLSNWFQNIFETGWHSVNALLNQESENLNFAFRQRDPAGRVVSVERIKLLDLGIQLGNKSVTLLVGLTREDEHKVGVRVQLHPDSEQSYLPANVKLSLVSKDGKTLQEFASRQHDNLIQLKRFICPLGKSFRIQVAVDDFCITEDFIV